MRPYGHDAETYTRPSWGGGIYGVLPMDSLSAILAAVIGVDFVFLQNEALTVQDPATGVGFEQEGDPNYYRIYVGGEVGGPTAHPAA